MLDPVTVGDIEATAERKQNLTKALEDVGRDPGPCASTGIRWIGEAEIKDRIPELAIVLGLSIAVAGQCAPPEDPALDLALARLRTEEGFEAHAYRDTRGRLTIGYGTNLSEGITQGEGDYLLGSRLRARVDTFRQLWPPLRDMPLEVRVELADMAYQLGPTNLDGFELMLGHLERGEWNAAADEALASAWHRETPARAEAGAAIFRALAGE